MVKKKYIIIFILLILASCTKQINKNSSINTNIINLSNENFNSKNIFEINSFWSFYWDTLLTPQQIANTKLYPLLVKTPTNWTSYKINEQNLPIKGKATYHINLSVKPNQFYGFKFKRIYSSYKLWINDSLYFENGFVTSNLKDNIPNDLIKELIIFSDTNNISIVIQVANYHFRNAGINTGIKIGNPQAIEKYTYSSLLYEVFILGALVFMMLFYFILYFYNKKVVSNLYFSLFLFFEVITLGFEGELFFLRIFPDIKWIIASKFWNIASYLRPLFLLLFAESLATGIFSKFIKKASIVFTIAMLTFIIFFPPSIYSKALPLLILFAISTLFYEIFIILKTIKQNKKHLFALIGLLSIFLTTFNDFLYEYGYLKTFYMVGMGVFIYALLQAFLLSLKNAELFLKAENLTTSVEIQNRLKEKLLSTPSYDVGKSLYAFIETVGVEKIVFFARKNDNLIMNYIVEKDKEFIAKSEILDFNNNSDLVCIEVIKTAFNEQKIVHINSKTKTYEYLHKNNIKDIIVNPIVENNRTISIIYIENRINNLNNAQISVLKSTTSQFQSIINTAVVYFRLQEMNQFLEKEVKRRTVEVEKQKQEIDIKNQELDEKIQLLEEQYQIQQEINDELNSQNLEMERQNNLLTEQNNEIEKQKNELEKYNSEISKNIEYASTILSALSQYEENTPFKEFFHLNRPRDIISGDFFWSKRFENIFIFALADSTGHGVPGALMSLLGIRLINKIVAEELLKDKKTKPAHILQLLRETIKKQLTEENNDIKDGYDITLCIFDIDAKTIHFAGAYNSMFVFKSQEIVQLKGDRMPIGSYIAEFEKPFTNQEVKVDENDMIYLFTDGYVDQFGGDNYNKFFVANFKKLLFEIHNKTSQDKLKYLTEVFEKWKGNAPQLDDVSVVGYRY